MSDLIKRQDAIDAANRTDYRGLTVEDVKNVTDEVVKELKRLPSAQPPYQYSEAYVHQIRGERDILQDMVDNMAKPKTGEWIKPTGMMPPEYHGHYECSECGCYAMRDWKRHKMVLSAYCPNCGVRMLNGGE